MSAKKIAEKIYHKDTVYGSFDDRTPTDVELIDYFSTWIEEYAKDYHKKQTVIDKEEATLQAEEDAKWWTKNI